MGLFATLGQAFRPERPILSVSLERPNYHWGETLRGRVDVQGGPVDQTLSRLSVRLVEHVDGGKDFSAWHPHESVLVGAEIVMPAGSTQSFPFALSLPETGNPSAEGRVVRFLWSVEAEAHVAHALSPRTVLAGFDLQYPPLPEAMRALRDALTTAAPLRLRSESRQGAKAVFQFAPLPEAAPALDGVMLTVEEANGEIIGTLQVNPQEHSLADHARALIHRDRSDYAISYPVVLLASRRVGDVPAEVVDDITNCLRPFLDVQTRGKRSASPAPERDDTSARDD